MSGLEGRIADFSIGDDGTADDLERLNLQLETARENLEALENQGPSLGNAFRSFGRIVAQVMADLIADITAAIAKFAILEGIKFAFGASTGGLGGFLLGAIGGIREEAAVPIVASLALDTTAAEGALGSLSAPSLTAPVSADVAGAVDALSTLSAPDLAGVVEYVSTLAPPDVPRLGGIVEYTAPEIAPLTVTAALDTAALSAEIAGLAPLALTVTPPPVSAVPVSPSGFASVPQARAQAPQITVDFRQGGQRLGPGGKVVMELDPVLSFQSGEAGKEIILSRGTF